MQNAVDLAPTWHPIDITVLVLYFVTHGRPYLGALRALMLPGVLE